jgi:hypothetical protein
MSLASLNANILSVSNTIETARPFSLAVRASRDFVGAVDLDESDKRKNRRIAAIRADVQRGYTVESYQRDNASIAAALY